MQVQHSCTAAKFASNQRSSSTSPQQSYLTGGESDSANFTTGGKTKAKGKFGLITGGLALLAGCVGCCCLAAVALPLLAIKMAKGAVKKAIGF